MPPKRKIDPDNIHRLITLSAQSRLHSIIKIVEDNKGAIRFVGGCVRNSLLGIKIEDIDLSTDLKPAQLIPILTKQGIKVIPTGLQHGTVTAVVGDNKFEITTLRKDLFCDGRHAIVGYANSWKEDAFRRDFTFNALYADKDGRIYDYCTGIEDLQSGELKFMGDPNIRIQEDYLRILRAFRFHARICTAPISSVILEACIKNAPGLERLSGERICEEMLKILSAEKAFIELKIIANTPIPLYMFGQPIQIPERTREISGMPIAKLALLIKSCHQPEAMLNFIRDRWKISNKTAKLLDFMVRTELDIHNVKDHIIDIGKESCQQALAVLYLGYLIPEPEYLRLRTISENWDTPIFPISGLDIIELGVPQGRRVKELLEQGKQHWRTSNYLAGKQEIMEYLKKQIQKKDEQNRN